MRVMNEAGLFVSLVGLLILFRYGMPFRIETGGAIYRVVSQIDEPSIKEESRYRALGYVGLAFSIIGTGLQIGATALA